MIPVAVNQPLRQMFCGYAHVFTCNFRPNNGNPVRRQCDDVWERKKKTLGTSSLSLSAEGARSQQRDIKFPNSLKALWMILHAGNIHSLWWLRCWWWRGASITSMDTSSFWLVWWQDVWTAAQGIWQWYSERNMSVHGASEERLQYNNNPPRDPAPGHCALTWHHRHPAENLKTLRMFSLQV